MEDYFKIYTLTNPVTNLVFYVGCTVAFLERRLHFHCYEYSNPLNARTPKKQIILDLAKINRVPAIEEIDSATNSIEALAKERFWIYQLKSWGFPLTNRQVIPKYEYEIIVTDHFPNGICVRKGETPPTEIIYFSKTRDRDMFNKLNPNFK